MQVETVQINPDCMVELGNQLKTRPNMVSMFYFLLSCIEDDNISRPSMSVLLGKFDGSKDKVMKALIELEEAKYIMTSMEDGEMVYVISSLVARAGAAS